MSSQPRFRRDLIPFRHEGTDEAGVIVLKDPVSEGYFRLTDFEYQFLRRFDGTRTLEEAREDFKAAGYYCTKEDSDFIHFKADQFGMLTGTSSGTAANQKKEKERLKSSKRAASASKIYFLFVPLWNPDRFLERTLWLVKLLANRWTALLVALMAPGALYFLVTGFSKMDRSYYFFFNLENLLYLWFTIATLKLVHELSHAYTAKHFGLHVPQMGVAFLIFFPCLYCNTTDAWQLADRKQRMAIGAAGIIAEGVLAVLATYVWNYSRPGIINSVAFYVMAASFITTVLFNANPLMRFDGYFVLVDYIRMPNLAVNSFGYLRYLFLNGVLGINSVLNTVRSKREAVLYPVYGVSALLYRVFLYSGIVGGVYYRFDKTLGVVLAALAFSLFVVGPLIKGSMGIVKRKNEIRPRFAGVVAFLAIVAAIVGMLSISWSNNTLFPCYVESAKIQKLTIPLKTSVAQVFVEEGTRVKSGTVLLELDTSELELSLMKKQLNREILNNEYQLMLIDKRDLGRLQVKRVEILQVEDETKRIKEDLRIARSGVTAPFDGVITNLDYRVQPGYKPGEGEIVGELRSQVDCVIRGLVPEKDRHKVQIGQEVEFWIPIGPGITLRKTIDDIKGYSERDLRESPFSSALGGEVATETRDERKEETPLEAQYMCVSLLSNEALRIPLGLTGRLVVSSPPRSALTRLADLLVRTFNRESFY